MARSISRWVYEHANNNAFQYAILVSLPSIYYPVLSNFGGRIHLKLSNGDLTALGIVTTLVISLLSVALVFLKAIGDKYNTDVVKNGTTVVGALLSSACDTRETKFSYYQRFIERNAKSAICEHFAPEQEITRQIKEFKQVVANLIGAPPAQVEISVHYKILDSRFKRICTNFEIAKIGDIVDNENSSIGHLLKHNGSLVFYPDKRIAIEHGRYISSQLDLHYDNRGSVYCERILVSNGEINFVDAFFTIRTHDKQICDQSDFYSMRKFSSIVTSLVREQIRVELAKLYISQNRNCPNYLRAQKANRRRSSQRKTESS